MKVTPHNDRLKASIAPAKPPIFIAKECHIPYLNGGKSNCPHEVLIHTQIKSGP
jgi:hypothetical protein